MSERRKNKEKADLRKLAQLVEAEPPAWVDEMRKYYLRHGRYRMEDLARLLTDQTGSLGSLPQEPSPTTIQLLHEIATRK